MALDMHPTKKLRLSPEGRTDTYLAVPCQYSPSVATKNTTAKACSPPPMDEAEQAQQANSLERKRKLCEVSTLQHPEPSSNSHDHSSEPHPSGGEARDPIAEVLDLKAVEARKWVDINTSCNERYTKNRSVLLQWVKDVAEQFNLQHITLHMICYYIDKILYGNPTCTTSVYQLIASCCINIGVKYEESYPQLGINHIIECTDYAFTRQEVLQYEKICLNALNWELSTATAAHFLELYLDHYIPSTNNPNLFLSCASLLCDLTLDDPTYIQHTPSFVAASAVATANRILKCPQVWPEYLEALTQYSFAQIAQLSEKMHSAYLELTKTPILEVV